VSRMEFGNSSRSTACAGAGTSKRDLSLSQLAFYSGARGVLKVLDHMIAEGDYEALHRVIERHGRQIKRIQARHPRARRH
jgi:hypothetical protein